MRKLVSERRVCDACGARLREEYACGSWNVAPRTVSFLDAFDCERIGRAPRVRSGLAHASGFAGVVYLFGYSLAPTAFARLPVAAAVCFLVAWGLFALLALPLAFAAAVSIDRTRSKAGALPALFGLVVGLWGTFDLLLVFESWLRYLKAF